MSLHRYVCVSDMYLLCIQKCFCLPNNCTVKDILILGDLTMEFKPLLCFKVVMLFRMYYGSIALLPYNILKCSAILGLLGLFVLVAQGIRATGFKCT